MKKILILFLAVLSAVSAGSALAADADIIVAPSSGIMGAGSSFPAVVQINPQGNKVCVVKGTINFSNLSCLGISVQAGLMPQTMPTCQNPAFVIGIPKCATAVQNILSVSAKGKSAGSAGISIANASVIGAGSLVPSAITPGVYEIKALPAPAPKSAGSSESSVESSQPSSSSQETLNPEDVAPASFLTAAQKYFWPLLIVVVVFGLAYWAYTYFGKKREQ